MKPWPEQSDLSRNEREPRVDGRGFTLIEILIGITLLVVGILGVATMFGTGYNTVGEGGRMTMAVSAARQMLEDVHLIPFDNLGNLNGPGGTGFDTSAVGTLPAGNPERDIARKWRYALAGDTDSAAGWNFTGAEKTTWKSLGVGTAIFGATGLVQVADVNNPVTLRRITVTVSIPGGRWTVQLATLVSR